jgi:uncharacterized Fe-S cluster-containing radical SAM superfamily protein
MEFEKKICEGERRKYYRFRADRFYGGVATADCLGCNMDCAFCWSYQTRINPDIGEFYTSAEVAEKLVRIAHKNRFRYVRISGNEPTLCKEHLLEVIRIIKRLDSNIIFILETNGIKLGEDENYVEDLTRYDNIHIRISFKTGNPENFEMITDRPKEWLEIQIKAVENLYSCKKISFHPAIVEDYTNDYLIYRLNDISPEIVERIEYESLKIYPHIMRRMRERGLF